MNNYVKFYYCESLPAITIPDSSNTLIKFIINYKSSPSSRPRPSKIVYEIYTWLFYIGSTSKTRPNPVLISFLESINTINIFKKGLIAVEIFSIGFKFPSINHLGLYPKTELILATIASIYVELINWFT